MSRRTFVVVNLLSPVTLLVVGVVGYYTGFQQIFWLPYLIATGVFGLHLLKAVRIAPAQPPSPSIKLPLFISLYIAFVASLAFATFINCPSLPVFLVGLKIYLPFFLLTFVVANLRDPGALCERAENFLLILPFIELPFVLHQHYFIMRAGGSIGNWDAVVGTFGGNPEGGGASPVLMLYCILSILTATGMMTARRLSISKALIVVSANLVIILHAEVKAFFLLMPLAFAIQHWRAVISRPLTTVLFAAIIAGGIYGIQHFYFSTYLTNSYYETHSLWEQVFDPDAINDTTGEVGRFASVAFWQANSGDLLHMLAGYGVAATRVKSIVALGVLGERFWPLNIAATSAAALLWESGLIGATLFFATLASAFLTTWRVRFGKDSVSAARMSMLSATVALLSCFCFYNNTVLDNPAVALLLALSLGLAWRYSHEGAQVHSPLRLAARAMRTRQTQSC